MKRKKMIAMLGALVLAVTMIGYAVAQERPAPPPPARPRPARRRPPHPGTNPAGEIHKKLRQTIPKLELPGVDFKNAIQFIREFGKVNIHVKWAALKQVGITKDSKVDVHLTNVTLDKALRTILEDVGGLTALAFIVDEGVITISTRDNLQIVRNMAMEDRRVAAEAAFPRRQAEHMEVMIGLVQRMKHVCFDSKTVGVMAVGALKDDVRRKDDLIIIDLNGQLASVKTQGLRNALRLTLKDIYKRQGKNNEVIKQLHALIAENDKALQAEEKK